MNKLKFYAVVAACLSTAFYFSNSPANSLSDELNKKVTRVLGFYYDNEFTVTSDDGVVQVKGEVKTVYDKNRISEIISKINGVKEIENLIDVKNSSVPDDSIKADFLQALNLNRSILEPDKINIFVDNGTIRLSGDVTFYREKLMAETIASWIRGVTDIVNNIQLRPRVEPIGDQDLGTVVKEILRDHNAFSSEIRFTVKEGVVTLDGSADNLWIKNELEKDLLRVKGVKYVINNINIEPRANSES